MHPIPFGKPAPFQIGKFSPEKMRVLQHLSRGHRPVSHVCALCARFPCLEIDRGLREEGRLDVPVKGSYLRPPCCDAAGYPTQWLAKGKGG